MIGNVEAFKKYLFFLEYFRIFVNKTEFEVVFGIKLFTATRHEDMIGTIRFLIFFCVE